MSSTMPAARMVSTAVHRADSLRSEHSDASQANKRVSFDVKHRGKKVARDITNGGPGGGGGSEERQIPAPVYAVYKEPTSLTEAELALEAERIIQQVDQISCTVSPNPVFETRSLERRPKRNNSANPPPPQQFQQQQQQQSVDPGWSRTLPGGSSTKNQLMERKNVVEKNSNIIQQQQREQQAITPPKYDSGIEMEGGRGDQPSITPGRRPNVNLIVQQLTEEARQRELIRQQSAEEPAAAPRLPVLSLIEPDPQFGVSHNRNLPFSYTGGVSPTRLSPLRSSGIRFPSPPKDPDEDEASGGVDPGLKDDIVYAQVKVRKQSKSPDPFHYPSAKDTVDRGIKINFRQEFDDEQRDEEEEDDLNDFEAMKAKARFLFGTRIEEDVATRRTKEQQHQPQDHQQQQSYRPSVRLDQRNNNRNASAAAGLSYNYSSLIKGRQQQEPGQGHSYTTKVLVNNESKSSRIQYKDRSLSPEPRVIQPTQSSVATRIRSLEMRSSPERYRDEIIQTLPQIKKAHHHQQQQQQQMTSTRLIQEAERGRTSSRRQAPAAPKQFTPYRPVQTRHESLGPPKPPLRVKKLSRERMEAPITGKTSNFRKVVPWQPDAGSESSPERTTTAFNNSSPARKSTSYRYPTTAHERSLSPSPERIRFYNNNNLNNNNQTMTLGRPISKKTVEQQTTTADGKQDKMRRQRSKFLSVFLGPKTGRSSSSSKTASVAVQTTATTATSSRSSSSKQPAISKWEDDVELSNQIRQQQKSRLTFQHHQESSAKDRNRRESTDRTDTSESDDVQHHRFKSLRQKSQSFNNLNYRPDPVRVLGEEEPRQRQQQHHDWNANNVDNNNAVNNNNVAVTGGRYYHSDARPYASTNLINQIGRNETANDVIIIDEGGINRPNPLDHNNPQRRPIPAPARQMRYFGDTDQESQQSVTNGHISHRPSVRYIPKANKVAQRSVSNAAGMGAVRRGVMQRNNGGVTNNNKTQLHSVNSSESEGNGSALQSGASAESQRSVYLHATTVADIPTMAAVPNSAKAQQMQQARRRATSREDMSALSGSDRTAGSTLRRTRQISRSYSVLAPWKPRHYRDKFEITYSNQQAPAGQAVNHHDVGKPPRVPPVISSSASRRREDVILESEDSADVYRPVHITSPNTKPSVTRSSTMPKSNKLMAGWFRKKKQR